MKSSWMLSYLPLYLHLVTATSPSTELPIVDLGYERHQAISYNETGRTYNFSNIRYAEPPVGDLRFRAPVLPRTNSHGVNNGSVGRVCPQASAAAGTISFEYALAYVQGQRPNVTQLEAQLPDLIAHLPPQDPRVSEDCLFLNVIVPESVLHSAQNTTPAKRAKLAPVLVWIHGGGYTSGEKTGGGLYNPAGLFHASEAMGTGNFVFVALNYRLGVFGFAAGPTLQAVGTANAALYDQRLALEWVQENIHVFGGDRTQVTVMGQSAGAGSILHQITAFGGLNGPAPFARAIPQSVAFSPIVSSMQQESALQRFMASVNVSTVEQLRQLPTTVLIHANAAFIANTSINSVFGPSVDGLFAPSLPGRLLLQGSFYKNVKLMIGHNALDSLIFTDPTINSTATFEQLFVRALPSISPSALDYITKVLYPPIFDGSLRYRSEYERTATAVMDSTLSCNAFYMDQGFKNKTHFYEFAVPPALHGFDTAYTFANGKSSPLLTAPSVASALQEYITSFVVNGIPAGKGIPRFPMYGSDSETIVLNATSIGERMDELTNSRCAWWQKALYY